MIPKSTKIELYLAISFTGETFYDTKLPRIVDNDKNPSMFIVRLIDSLDRLDQKVVLILDNAVNHLIEEVLIRILKSNSKLIVLYSVPYLCELNMAEYMFCSLKTTIRKQEILTIDHLNFSLRNLLSNISKEEVKICNGKFK